jgi:hypothetical protein
MFVVSMALLYKLCGLQNKTAYYKFKKVSVVWSHTTKSVILIIKDNMQHSYTYIEFWPHLLKALKFTVRAKKHFSPLFTNKVAIH